MEVNTPGIDGALANVGENMSLPSCCFLFLHQESGHYRVTIINWTLSDHLLCAEASMGCLTISCVLR